MLILKNCFSWYIIHITNTRNTHSQQTLLLTRTISSSHPRVNGRLGRHVLPHSVHNTLSNTPPHHSQTRRQNAPYVTVNTLLEGNVTSAKIYKLIYGYVLEYCSTQCLITDDGFHFQTCLLYHTHNTYYTVLLIYCETCMWAIQTNN